MSVNWEIHNGKRILHTSFCGLTTNEKLFAVLDESERQVLGSPEKVLLLVDVSSASITTEFMNRIKSNTSAAEHTQRLALVGITGLKKVLIDGYLWMVGNRFGEMKLCDTVEAAREYLAGA